MEMHKMAVIGDASSLAGFTALGITVLPAENKAEGAELLHKAAEDGNAVIFITEGIAAGMIDEITAYSKKPLPIVLTIPDNEGNKGAALEKLRRTVEKALGADILFGKEGTGQ